MTPYYEHAGITIYHGDCREVLPFIVAFDLLLTDPPYGIAWQSGRRSDRYARICGDESIAMAIDGLRVAFARLRMGRHAYVFGPLPLDGLGVSRAVDLIWDKGAMSSGDLSLPWGAQHEPISFVVRDSPAHLAAGAGGLTARMRRGSVLRFARINGSGKDTHPTEKPIGLLRELIESSSRIGEIVCDPFAGTGSALVASLRESRRAIGIEIEERYCEIAAKRLQQEALPLEQRA